MLTVPNYKNCYKEFFVLKEMVTDGHSVPQRKEQKALEMINIYNHNKTGINIIKYMQDIYADNLAKHSKRN